MNRIFLVGLSALVAARVWGAEINSLTSFDFDSYLLLPVQVHLLEDEHRSHLHTTLSPEDVARIFQKVNRVWAQAGLHFFVDTIVREEAKPTDALTNADATAEQAALLSLRPTASRTSSRFHIYFIKEMTVNGFFTREAIFVKDTASLREVEGGIDEPLPRVTSHELGHALGLAHRQNRTNLMASGTTGIALNAEEISAARRAATALSWGTSATSLLQQADALHETGKLDQARILYRRLAGLPKLNSSGTRIRNGASGPAPRQ